MMARGVIGGRVIRPDYSHMEQPSEYVCYQEHWAFNLLKGYTWNCSFWGGSVLRVFLWHDSPSHCVMVDIGGYGRCHWRGGRARARVLLVVACSGNGAAPASEILHGLHSSRSEI